MYRCRIPYNKINRHKRGFVFTRRMEKIYQPVFEKGLVLPTDLSTRPFGWSGDTDDDDVEKR